ncbi:MAG: hypothetical protein GXO82_00280 [Chlorobi bacterium]|nr:hypothetical protein [Chlorobiota bacterium]
MIREFGKKIEEWFGLRLNKNKQKELPVLLVQRARFLGFRTEQEYLRHLGSNTSLDTEMKYWASVLTVNETYFFRNREQWKALEEVVIPYLLMKNSDTHQLSFLSLGAASGEEPYTLALVLASSFPHLTDWNIEIHATDIDEEKISAARNGLYAQRSVNTVPDELLEQYFLRCNGRYRLDDKIRSKVRFFYHNILKLPSGLPHGKYDVIICRNVIIYFSESVAKTLIRRMAEMLTPQGFLMLGHSEGYLTSGLNVSPRFEQGAVLYQYNNGISATSDSSDPFACQLQSPLAPEMQEFRDDRGSNDDVLDQSREKEHVQEVLEEILPLIDKKKFWEAKQRLDYVLSLKPLSPHAFYLLGMWYFMQEMYGDALHQFDKVRYIKPDHVMNLLHLALTSQKLGKMTEAREYYHYLTTVLQSVPSELCIDEYHNLTAGFIRILAERNMKGLSYA